MQYKVKNSYNKVVTSVTPFVVAVTAVSLLLAGSILLGWINVENPTGLGYFLLAQGFTIIVYASQNKQEK